MKTESAIFNQETGIATKSGYTDVYHYNENTGKYVGKTYEFIVIGTGLPAYSCLDAPDLESEYAIVRVNNTWEYLEDHRGKQGYVNGEPFTMTTYGALPEGFSDTAPEPTKEELNQTRIAEIKMQLEELDNRKVHPALAIASWWALPEDKRDPKGIQDESTLLLQLDKESSMLREELHVIEMYEVEKEE